MLIYFGEYVFQNKYNTNAKATTTTVTVNQLQPKRKIGNMLYIDDYLMRKGLPLRYFGCFDTANYKYHVSNALCCAMFFGEGGALFFIFIYITYHKYVNITLSNYF